MSVADPTARRRSAIARGLLLLVRPGRGWAEIAAEPMSLREIWLGYAAPLAAAPAVCGVIGGLVFGAGIAGIDIRPPVGGLIGGALVDYGLTLAGVGLMGLVVAGLSPVFGGRGGALAGVKVVAYSATPVWLAGVFALAPSIGWAATLLAALYGLYLMGEGLPALLGVPRARALVCLAAIILAGLALGIVLGIVSADARSVLGGPLRVVS